ncbi:sulfate adenylyltransferase subunit CysN [Kushneria aurantia]|uniref:Sulfate adenylyltransferase subunit 1 n=1 Tax=Kushneria aurantia TaxID=504092 RepID=A0ABV6G8K0_9GAMM|nr:sulfate adenylyltransferase subunit CysN [Kushneria aurantia]
MAHQSALIADNIEQYLKEHESKDLLRFITCGSVDDGKSTLIGRLLHDSKMIYEDQLAALSRDSKTRGTTGDRVDLALLVDGLQSEREQGITIDVAYRFFSTDRRKFIIADTPGHEQYTRNMATGASTASLAVILIDARYGVQTQTRRHSFICDLLGIQHLVVAVNKMDLVDYSEARFEEIRGDYLAFAENLNARDIRFVPMSALEGDNVVNPSDNMAWYRSGGEPGTPLLSLLENAEIRHDSNTRDLRFPVQYVNRPNLDFRGYAGTLAAGVLRPGQAVKVMPSGKRSTVERLVTFDGDLSEAWPGQAITVTLADEVDVSRGDWLVAADERLPLSNAFTADIVWMNERELVPGRGYDFKLATRSLSGSISAIDYGIDVNELTHHDAERLALNEIGRCRVALTEAVPVDAYDVSPGTGSFIVIDRMTNLTVGAGMIREAVSGEAGGGEVDWQAFEVELNDLIRRHFPHWQARDVGEILGGRR